jgi:putative SOS response-associated peptidase YedK
MCARITRTTTAVEIPDLFGLGYDLALPPRYNVAPSQAVPVVRADGRGGRELVEMRWGFVPHWSRDPKPAALVNARAETAAEKPAFRDAFRRRRCLVPADGFYEWEHVGRRKQPYHFRRAGGGLIAFAAVWDTWASPGGPVDGFAVLTTDANEVVRPLHDRMPAILDPDHFAAWLDPREYRPAALLPLLTPYPAAGLEWWPVSDRVNAVTVEEPGLTTAVALPAPRRAGWVQPSLFDAG